MAIFFSDLLDSTVVYLTKDLSEVIVKREPPESIWAECDDVDLGLLKPPEHYGVILDKAKNIYVGIYACDGNMRLVTEGRLYERVFDAVQRDSDRMRRSGHTVDANVGQRRPITKEAKVNEHYRSYVSP